MITNNPLQKKQQGLSLIEILIAMVIGVILIGGILGVFIHSKKTYRMQENLSRIQENGRFALEFMSRDIRMTDFRACHSDLLVSGAISGTEGTSPPADSIAVSWKTNTCGNAAVTTSRAYRINGGTLQQSVDGGTYVTLIENIENMQILYGVDTDIDGTPNYYIDAGSVPDWAQVIAVRINLLAVSPDGRITSKPVNYTFNGNTQTPADRRLRREFSTTIMLRNRLGG